MLVCYNKARTLLLAMEWRPVALFLVSAWVALLDQISKSVVSRLVPMYGSVVCLGGLVRITHVRNAGAAFGVFQGRQPMLIAAALAAVGIIVVSYPRVSLSNWPARFGLGLGLGGALGNLIDRLRFGGVVDFVEVGPWPVFNLADTAIVVGVALILLGMMRSPGRKEE
jgi:signal peptidase II